MNYSLILGSHDLNGKMKAIVLTNEDPKNLGRIGVYIPRVMSLIPNESEAEKGFEIPSKVKEEFSKDMDLKGSIKIDTVNYIWAKPFMYGYYKDGISGGEWKIPPVGAKVIVEFIDADPQQLYYMPFAPYDEDSGFEFDPYETDGTGTVSIEVLYKSLNRNIVLFDSTNDKDIFVIKMKSGMTFQMDAKNNTMEFYTNNAETHVTVNGGDVTVENEGNTTINTNGDVTVTTEGNLKAEVTGNTELHTANGNIDVGTDTGNITFKTIDAVKWLPNCLGQCLFAKVPHGGAPTIVHLKHE